VLILSLNVWLLEQGVGELLGSAANRVIVWIPLALAGVALSALLFWISFEPLISHWIHRFGRAPLSIPEPPAREVGALEYRRILVPLDHTGLDQQAVGHAAALARAHHAKLFLLHVEEGVTSQVYGPLSSTAEVEAGAQYLERVAESLRAEGLEVETAIVHSNAPRREIVRYADEVKPDLVIMGAHGHRRLKDLILGNTIDPVRHELRMPLLIVRKS
jgi:manganese transport protein